MSLIRWRNIAGVDAPSQVSDGGQVRQKHRIIRGKLVSNAIRNQTVSPKGSHYVGFRIDGKQKNLYVHRLVARVFVRNKLGHKFVVWKDGDRSNNSSKNLKWVKSTPRSACRSRGKLTLDDAKIIRRDRAFGIPVGFLALRYNVSTSMISRVANGHRWS